MATPHPISNGSKGGHCPGKGPITETSDLDVAEPSRMSTYVPQHQRLPTSSPRDLHLLPSQRLRARDTNVRVQPTDNPYHWEAPQSRNGNISTWVKASWARTNEIVRQRAGTLNRKAAVRRSRKYGLFPTADGTNGCAPQRRSEATLTMRCSFSFEHEKGREDSSTVLGDIEEETDLSKNITRVDSGVLSPSAARTTRFHEELKEPPAIARTFSEILGSETFVPTALLKGE